MRTEIGKMSGFRTMPPSGAVKPSTHGDRCDDPRVNAMWDEEFFGHEMPPNYKISRARSPDGQEKSRQDPPGRADLMVERALWDEEFLGHFIPPNYTISRFRTPIGTPEAQEKQQGGVGKVSGCHRGSNRQAKPSNPDDILEYNFDKTEDGYVLSEVSPGGGDEWGGAEALPLSVMARHEFIKGETFEERALRFGVEDWNLFGNRKWAQSECKDASKGGSKRSTTRRAIFHSPTGSDTSSMISTFESSSFSCGSEGSSFAKTDLSSSSFNLSSVYAMSGGPNPPSGVGRYLSGSSLERRTGEELFVEFDILDPGERLDSTSPKGNTQLNRGFSGPFFEYNFLDGKMVDCESFNGSSEGTGAQLTMGDGNERSSEGAAAPGQLSPVGMDRSVTSKSPDSESLFDSSHVSDWSGTHIVSTVDHQGGLALTRDTETIFFNSDNGSKLIENRAGEDRNGGQHCSNGNLAVLDHSVLPASTSPLGGIKGQDPHIKTEAEVSPAEASASTSRPDSSSASAADVEAKLCSSSSKPPRKMQGTSRRTRSLGSVLTQHLAFTSVPFQGHRSQPSLSAEQKESPAKVSAACVEWLRSEKEAMKRVQTLGAGAERESAERERIGSIPSFRTSDQPPTTSRSESETFSLGTQQHAFNSRCLSMDMSTLKRVETSNTNVHKESRDSILASWATVNGTAGAAAARAVRRSSTTAGKVSLSTTTPLKHSPRGCASPRRRSVSFSAQASSRMASSVAKQPSGLELEVLCRPFGPVLKGVRFLPTAKRSLGKPPLFSKLGPKLAASSTISLPAAVLKCGRLQCVVSRDGLPSYILIMDETEEIFAAKTLRLDAGLQEGVSHVYSFHSYKGHGKGKPGWRQWRKKEKPGSDFAGNMTVTSTICPVLSSNGAQNYGESEFVLFDAKVKEISISGPTSTSPYPRSSVSSWGTATPQRSPQQGASPSISSPGSTCFSLPSPSGAINSTPATVTTIPPQDVLPLEKSGSHAKQLDRHMSMTSPSEFNRKSVGHESCISDSEKADDCEPRGICPELPESQTELAAVVVRTPMEKSQGKAAPSGDKWGWGINFLRKSFDGSKSGSSPERSVTSSGDSPSSEEKSAVRNSTDGSRNSTDQQFGSSPVDEHSHGGLNITLILPSGEHGCSANGIDGPQPLTERWKSGGKCDCGSWDLGCGLTIVGNEKVSDSVDAPVNGKLRDDALRLYVEGKKEQTVGWALTPLKEGCYTLEFQPPISPLHAFATAVAVLHSRDPVISSKKAGEMKKRLTRIPVKVVPAVRFSRQTEDQNGSLVSYKLAYADPPSSPFGRA